MKSTVPAARRVLAPGVPGHRALAGVDQGLTERALLARGGELVGAEPASEPWDGTELTRLCRLRAPAPTALVVVGGWPDAPAVGTLTVTRVPAGVHERLCLAVGAPHGPDTDALDQLADRLADRHPVRTLLAGLRPGRSDATVAPGVAHPTVPHGLLLGADIVRRRPEAVRSAPAPLVVPLGDARTPACWKHLLGDRAADPAVALSRVLHHVGALD